nr:transposase [Trueperella pecoris]
MSQTLHRSASISHTQLPTHALNTRLTNIEESATVAAWERAWDRFIPFLAFGPATRKAIYTTNAIESLNYQLRKITKNRGHFPSDMAAVKLLWLAITNIEDKRTRERAKEAGLPKGAKRKAPGRLIQGQGIQGWQKVLGEFALHYPDRFPQI